MLCFPNAKINLGLNIVSRRSDGYHELETIFYPVEIKDALEIVPTKAELTVNREYRLFQSGLTVEGNEDYNLVIKALRLIRREQDISAIDIHLLKKIPFGAGLGGGSANAAAMLKLTNKMFKLGYSNEQLIEMAVELGADCPFFIKNKPVFATGIGEKMEDIELDLSNYHFVLIKPDISINTGWAYSVITPKRPDISLKEIAKMPIGRWKEVMTNDFETPIFKKHPQINDIKQQLYELGAVYASMSGSGSSVYGFFNKMPQIDNLFTDHFVWSHSPKQ